MITALRTIVAIAGLLLTAQALVAQQPTPQRERMKPGMGEMGMRMDSLDARLDSLVARMNRATGGAKVAAMADVLTEFVAQRKAMRRHMQQMQEHMQKMMRPGGMMGPMHEPPRDSSPPVPAAGDTAGHADHHPPQ